MKNTLKSIFAMTLTTFAVAMSVGMTTAAEPTPDQIQAVAMGQPMPPKTTIAITTERDVDMDKVAGIDPIITGPRG